MNNRFRALAVSAVMAIILLGTLQGAFAQTVDVSDYIDVVWNDGSNASTIPMYIFENGVETAEQCWLRYVDEYDAYTYELIEFMGIHISDYYYYQNYRGYTFDENDEYYSLINQILQLNINDFRTRVKNAFMENSPEYMWATQALDRRYDPVYVYYLVKFNRTRKSDGYTWNDYTLQLPAAIRGFTGGFNNHTPTEIYMLNFVESPELNENTIFTAIDYPTIDQTTTLPTIIDDFSLNSLYFRPTYEQSFENLHFTVNGNNDSEYKVFYCTDELHQSLIDKAFVNNLYVRIIGRDRGYFPNLYYNLPDDVSTFRKIEVQRVFLSNQRR